MICYQAINKRVEDNEIFIMHIFMKIIETIQHIDFIKL